MDISRLDYWAASGDSVIHRSTVLFKVLSTALIIASIVVTHDLPVLFSVYVLVLITVRAAGLPLLPVLGISIFPGLFAILFAVSQLSAGWQVPVTTIMKALTAATAMILLISTTPFADVVGFAGRCLPRVVMDGLFMTYRSFFILLEQFDHFLKALRLRGGFRPHRLIKNSGNIAAGIGHEFIRALDKSQMLYNVMTIRGYSGKLGAERGIGRITPEDFPYFIAAAFFLAEAVFIGRLGHVQFYRAMPVVLILYLAVMEVYRSWKR
ncbi:MAG: CbiQ family ECF transporter T component [Nitrospirota bacterium]